MGLHALAVQRDKRSTTVEVPQQNPLTMNLPSQLLISLRVDRAPPKGGAGLFAVSLGALGLGAVTP